MSGDLRKSLLGRHVKKIGVSHGPVNYNPVKWQKYFDSEKNVETDKGTFHVYEKGQEGPVLFCLHGGGYSGLTWALFAAETFNQIKCHVVAMDLRGHGGTTTKDDDDMSLGTLANDVVEVISKMKSIENRPVILIGHSMGGAVAVEAAGSLDCIAGLCVIDVVEGTALDALSSMQSVLRGRPKQFKSLPYAIQWCYKGGQTHNIEAAKVSMPGQIINIKTNKLAADEWETFENLEPISKNEPIQTSHLSALSEEAETDSDRNAALSKPPLPKTARTEMPSPKPVETSEEQYTWRIDLMKTEKFWTGWFKDLSQKFLDVRVPKILLLANIHGLDTTLTVGQMQGKFQLQVLNKSGHAIHEDQPENVSEIISGYLVKQKLAEAQPQFVGFSMPAC